MRLIRRGTGRSACRTTLFTLLFTASAWGALQGMPFAPITMEVGKPAIVCSATPASGLWAREYPFKAETYGLVRGISPVTEQEPKIVLYTLTLNKDFLRLTAAVDAFVARNKGLERSLVQVIDTQGAQRGGYSADELKARLAAIRKVAEDNKITHLSFVVSASNAASFGKRLGLEEGSNPDLLIAHLGTPESPAEKNKRAIIKWMDRYNTDKLSDKTIQEIIVLLERSVTKK